MRQQIGPLLAPPCAANAYHGAYIRRVVKSYTRAAGANLIAEAGLDEDALGPSAWFGDFALLTHRGDGAATLNYANRFALGLWECDWDAFAGLPSAVTAPPEDRIQREAAMQNVAHDNFVHGYGGRRISRKGTLFRIENATLWRLLDEDGSAFGVGAFFRA